MKKLLFIILACFACLSLSAQEIKVKYIELDPSDRTPSTNPHYDGEGEPCALVKVVIPGLKGMLFQDDFIMEDPVYTPGEYRMWVSTDIRKIKFQHEDYLSGIIDFKKTPLKGKCAYIVMLDVPLIEKYKTECSAKTAEGSRLFGMREYENARVNFVSALASRDATDDLTPSIRRNIALCDTCIVLNKQTNLALAQMLDLKKSGSATQAEVAKWATIAADNMRILDRYNPSDFYKGRIAKLDKLVEDMPLMIRFTLVKWEKTVAGVSDAGPMPLVEVWSYMGDEFISTKKYKNDKKFMSLVKGSTEFQKLGESNGEGIVDVSLDRKNLPEGIFFRPVGYDESTIIDYLPLQEILDQSKTDQYNMRRFRQSMFIDATR